MTQTTELPAMPASISAKMHCLDYKPEEKQELWLEIQKELQLATAEAVKQVTRLEVIEKGDRKYVGWNRKVELDYQDGGRTLKVFVDTQKD